MTKIGVIYGIDIYADTKDEITLYDIGTFLKRLGIESAIVRPFPPVLQECSTWNKNERKCQQ